MNDSWKKLSEAAQRRPPAEVPPAELPYGFTTRVLARVREARDGGGELWLRWSLRALPVGALALAICWLAIRPLEAEPVNSNDLAELAVIDALQK